MWQTDCDPLLTFEVGEEISYYYWVDKDSNFVGISIDIQDQQYDISMEEWELALVQIFHITSINHTKEVLEKFFKDHDAFDFENTLKKHQISFIK